MTIFNVNCDIQNKFVALTRTMSFNFNFYIQICIFKILALSTIL